MERLNRRATVAEVKRNPERYKSKELEEKYEHIKAHLRGYKVELLELSMDDM